MAINFLSETTQTKRQKRNIFRVLKDKNLSPKIFIQQNYHSKVKAQFLKKLNIE